MVTVCNCENREVCHPIGYLFKKARRTSCGMPEEYPVLGLPSNDDASS